MVDLNFDASYESAGFNVQQAEEHMRSSQSVPHPDGVVCVHRAQVYATMALVDATMAQTSVLKDIMARLEEMDTYVEVDVDPKIDALTDAVKDAAFEMKKARGG